MNSLRNYCLAGMLPGEAGVRMNRSVKFNALWILRYIKTYLYNNTPGVICSYHLNLSMAVALDYFAYYLTLPNTSSASH